MTGAEPGSVTLDIMDVCRFRDGLIVEHWGVPDRFSQMQQLGLLAVR
jgi:predicted SnoaL-like aldol condensation-catalyzing enzyme